VTITTGRTILVVEDVEEISLQMNQLLTKRGHQVLLASSAEEAIRIVEQSRPAMILTDLDLPTLGLLMKLISEHTDLGELVVAVIDINHPEVSNDRLRVLPDFDALDNLIGSTQNHYEHQS
jgi:CheY-like chemotaxis protein